jgi:hypothetical protein
VLLAAVKWVEVDVVDAPGAAGACGGESRESLRLGELPKLPVRLLGSVYLIDLCLSPIGMAGAFAAAGRPAVALTILPLGLLLMFFARDRRARMQAAVELTSRGC